LGLQSPLSVFVQSGNLRRFIVTLIVANSELGFRGRRKALSIGLLGLHIIAQGIDRAASIDDTFQLLSQCIGIVGCKRIGSRTKCRLLDGRLGIRICTASTQYPERYEALHQQRSIAAISNSSHFFPA
jgi:hypothetical protein